VSRGLKQVRRRNTESTGCVLVMEECAAAQQEAAHVLLIDDNPDDRALIARELQRSGTRVRITEVGDQQGLDAALARNDVDLVVTDFQLRWTTGLEVLRRIKSIDPLKPVIMFTGSGTEEIAVEAMKEGLDDYITKTAKHYPRVPYAAAGLLQRSRQHRELLQQKGLLEEIRARAQQQLRESEERFRAVQEASPDGFAVLECVPDEHGKVVDFVCVYLNEAAARMAKRSREELVGSRLLALYPGHRDVGLFDRYVDVARSGIPWIGEVEYRTEGLNTFVRIAAARVGNGVGVSIVDVSERKRAELALIEADRQKDEFLAMLAHELRNPLAPIRNASELLARMLGSDHDAQQIVDILKRQVAHVARLVDDLLDISRITRKRIELKKEVVDVASIVSQAVETVEPLISARHHDLQIQSSYRPLRVCGDAARLVQCLVNLLTNAAKFTESGGRIQLRTSEAHGHVVIEVIDNGEGIAPALLPRVFDLFVQSDRSLDRSLGGLGIGLSVVQRLAEMHGGEVTAHSEGQNLGSVFTLRLPLFESAAPKPEAPAPTKVDQQRILIVDDNADAANTLRIMLQMEGHITEVAYTSLDALEKISGFKPTIALLDIGLPEMDGYELARQIRKLSIQGQTRLIALTGYGQPDDRERALKAGFDDHLAKPVEFEVLARSIAARN